MVGGKQQVRNSAAKAPPAAQKRQNADVGGWHGMSP